MEQMQTSDHDLLIQLNVNVTTMRDEMRQNAQQFNGQVTDHETRLRVLEQGRSVQQGSSAANKWLVGTLIAALGVAVTIIALIWSNK